MSRVSALRFEEGCSVLRALFFDWCNRLAQERNKLASSVLSYAMVLTVALSVAIPVHAQGIDIDIIILPPPEQANVAAIQDILGNIFVINSRHVGARISGLQGGLAGIKFPKIRLNSNEQSFTGTQFAGLLPFAVSGAFATNESSPFDRLGVFINGEINFGDQDSTNRQRGFEFHIPGITGGVDYRFTDNFFLGAAFNFSSVDADLDSDGGGVDANAYSGSLYGTYYILEKIHFEGIVTFGFITYDIERSITSTTIEQAAESETDGTQFSFSFGGGYDFDVGGFTLTPLARLDYIRVDIDGYREHIDNTNSGALRFDSRDVDSLTSVLGAQGSYAISTSFGVLLPQVRFDWLHEFLNDSKTIKASGINDNDTVSSVINITTNNPDRNFFNLGGGMSGTFAHGISAFIYYETLLGLDDLTSHNIVAGIRMEL